MHQTQNESDGENEGEEADESQRTRTGLRALVGSVLLTTSSHIVSAPLARYLIRNESRFGCSHDEFGCLFSDCFFKPQMNELVLAAVDGEVFATSHAANYLFRPL